MGQPLAQIALMHTGLGCEFGDRHRPFDTQRLIKTKRVTDVDESDAGCAAKVRQHLPDKLVQFGVVEHVTLRSLPARCAAAECLIKT